MKLLLFTYFLFQSLFLTAQVCDTIVDGEPMNCIDLNGLKQGTWVTYENKLRYCYDSLGINSLSSIGNYKDNKKIGSWRYFIGPKYNSGITKEVIYHTSDSIEENMFGFMSIAEKTIFKSGKAIYKKVESFVYSFVMEFKDGERIIKGEYIANQRIDNNQEKVSLICEGDSCLFTLDDNQVLLSFTSQDLNKFEFELERLAMGLYTRKIKTLKAAVK